MSNRSLSVSYQIVGTSIVAHPYGVVYQITLTGTPDYSVAASSFTLLQNNSKPSYLQVSGPFDEETISMLLARPDEEIVIERAFLFSDGTVSGYEELFRANYDDVSFSRGAGSQSITVRATKQITNLSPKTVTLSRVASEELQADGKMLWKVPLATSIEAGDSAVIDEVTYELESVRWYVTPRQAWLDLKEI